MFELELGSGRVRTWVTVLRPPTALGSAERGEQLHPYPWSQYVTMANPTWNDHGRSWTA